MGVGIDLLSKMYDQAILCILLSVSIVSPGPSPQSAIDYAAQFSALNYFTTTTTTTTTPAPNQTSEELSSPQTLGALLEPFSAINIANPFSALNYVQNISAVAVAHRFHARITTTTTTT